MRQGLLASVRVAERVECFSHWSDWICCCDLKEAWFAWRSHSLPEIP